jgi:Domain of unknown function (DUF4268)
MYTHEEAKEVKQKFWTSFGKYMLPVPPASGEKINWINYKTGVKGISFKLDADNTEAIVAIEFHYYDYNLQIELYNKFLQLKAHFEPITGNDWEYFEDHVSNSGKNVSVIIKKLPNIKIFRESDWPQIISFFKQNIIAIDQFWNEWKPAFEGY